MLSPDILYLIAIEQHHDRMKIMALREQLLAAELDRPGPSAHRKLAYRLGSLLRKWGLKLENLGDPQLQPKCCH